MQRFFCKGCKLIKRVQHLPRNVENSHSRNPKQRIGHCGCKYHEGDTPPPTRKRSDLVAA